MATATREREKRRVATTRQVATGVDSGLDRGGRTSQFDALERIVPFLEGLEQHGARVAVRVLEDATANLHARGIAEQDAALGEIRLDEEHALSLLDRARGTGPEASATTRCESPD